MFWVWFFVLKEDKPTTGGKPDFTVDGAYEIFAEETFKGPKIEKTWKLIDDFSVKIKAVYKGSRISQIKYALILKGKSPAFKIINVKEIPDFFFEDRNSGKIKGHLKIQLVFLDYDPKTHTISSFSMKGNFRRSEVREKAKSN